MNNSEHLSALEFASIIDGSAGPLDADRWLSHLEDCQECRSKFDLQFDELPPIDQSLRTAMQKDDPYPDEEGFVRLSRWISEGLSVQQNRQQTLTRTFPAEVGHYQLIRVIGCGGMGIVYEAKHRWLNRRVAIKLLRADKGINPRSLHQFTREFEAVGRLDHPGIVRAIDAGCSQGHAFLVMELLDGLDLEQVRRCSGTVSEANLIKIAIGTAEGLQHAHSNGVVHRDVKPSNLMLARNRDGSEVTVRLMDLGLGKIESELFPAPAERSMIVGTEGYRAPEQSDATASSNIDHRADVFGLGATLLSLSTNLHRGQWTAESALRSQQLSSGLRELLASMLSRSPDDRPATMRDVITKLREIQAGSFEDTNTKLANLLDAAVSQSESSSHVSSHSWNVLTDSVLAETKPFGPLSGQSDVGATRRNRSMWIGVFLLFLCIGIAWSEFRRRVRTGGSSVDRSTVSRDLSQSSDDKTVEGLPPMLSQQVAREVLRLGGKWETANNNGDTLVVESLETMPTFPAKIDWIMLEGTPATDLTINLLTGLTDLEGLVLSNTMVTDKGVKRLGQIESLRHVYLYGTDVTDESVPAIVKLPHLSKLIVSETRITNRSLQTLKNNRTLKRLGIKGTQVNFRGIPALGTISSLRNLDIRDLEVSDQHLAPLLNLILLEEIAVAGTNISEQGIRHLISLPRIHLIEAGESQISRAKASELMREFPRIRIDRERDD